MNATRLRRHAARQPAALRVLAAAGRRGFEVVAVAGRLRYDARSAFGAGLLGDLIIHEAEIVVVLERCREITYRAALRRCWTCPRCLCIVVTALAGPRCSRCGFREGS